MLKLLQPYWLTLVVIFLFVAVFSIAEVLYCIISNNHCHQKDLNNEFDYILDKKNDKISTYPAKDFIQEAPYYA